MLSSSFTPLGRWSGRRARPDSRAVRTSRGDPIFSSQRSACLTVLSATPKLVKDRGDASVRYNDFENQPDIDVIPRRGRNDLLLDILFVGAGLALGAVATIWSLYRSPRAKSPWNTATDDKLIRWSCSLRPSQEVCLKKWIGRVALSFSGLALIVAGGYALVLFVGPDTSPRADVSVDAESSARSAVADLVIAYATAITAVATAIAAIAALFAARDSSNAARDASDAFAVATKPEVRVFFDHRDPANHRIFVENTSMNLITSGSVEWSRRNGRTMKESFDEIAARKTPQGNVYVAGSPGPHVNFATDPIEDDATGRDTSTVRYRGVGGVTWERVIVNEYSSGGRSKRIVDEEKRLSF